MANEIQQKPKTAIVIADSADYAGSIGTRTGQIDLTDLASTAARQSDKVDLAINGANLAPFYEVLLALEFASAPTSLEQVNVYAAFSPSATAATANPGGISGSDSAYTGTSGDSLDDSLTQLHEIGALSTTADATANVQYQSIGRFYPQERYVSFVVYNQSSQALHSDAVEMGIRIVPYVNEAQ